MAEENFNPYEILGIARDADVETVRAAYRELAKTNHPDAGGSAEDFHRINRAMSLLLDVERRRVFDECGVSLDREAVNGAFVKACGLVAGLVNERTRAFFAAGQRHDMDPRFDAKMLEHIEFKLQTERRKIVQAVASGAEMRAFTIDMMARFETDDPRDPIRRSLEGNLTAGDHLAEQAEEQIRIHDEAIAIVRGYRFRADAPGGRPPYGDAVFGNIIIDDSDLT